MLSTQYESLLQFGAGLSLVPTIEDITGLKSACSRNDEQLKASPERLRKQFSGDVDMQFVEHLKRDSLVDWHAELLVGYRKDDLRVESVESLQSHQALTSKNVTVASKKKKAATTL